MVRVIGLILVLVLGFGIDVRGSDSKISMVVTGDILLDSGVKRLIDKKGYDAVLDRGTVGVLKSADIFFANLEMPISSRGVKALDKQFTFRGAPKDIAFLSGIGVDIVTLANNHTLDFGLDALFDTLDILDKAGIGHVGAGRNIGEAKDYKVIEVKGKKIAFLGASRVIPEVGWYATEKRGGVFATYDSTMLVAQIKEAKKSSDMVVVYAHWGAERAATKDYQKTLAHDYINAGADIVLGTHPHILQGFEYYKGKLIAYSLGNFIFTDVKKNTAILKLDIDGDKVAAQVIPCVISNQATSIVRNEEKKKAIIDEMEKVSIGVAIDDNGKIDILPN